jgi:hypothetical protein
LQRVREHEKRNKNPEPLLDQIDRKLEEPLLTKRLFEG